LRKKNKKLEEEIVVLRENYTKLEEINKECIQLYDEISYDEKPYNINDEYIKE
jgi:hypothetical protein